jgi:hypothetical protein
MLYVIRNLQFGVVKIGFWSSTPGSLWSRYQTFYGCEMLMSLYQCDNIQSEKKTHTDLAAYCYDSEIYYICYIDKIFEYLDAKFVFISESGGYLRHPKTGCSCPKRYCRKCAELKPDCEYSTSKGVVTCKECQRIRTLELNS